MLLCACSFCASSTNDFLQFILQRRACANCIRVMSDSSQHSEYESGSEAEFNVPPSEEDLLEARHFREVVHAFDDYQAWASSLIENHAASLKSLSAAHKAKISSFEGRIFRMHQAAECNNTFIREILNFENIFQGRFAPIVEERRASSQFNLDKVRTTLKQFVRDWAVQVTMRTCAQSSFVCARIHCTGKARARSVLRTIA
jgi:hypothetical protein